MRIDEMRKQRRMLLEKPRRIIFNNDGSDAVLEMKESTKQGFLDARSMDLPGTQVDTVFYTPTGSGFGQAFDAAELAMDTSRDFRCGVTRLSNETMRSHRFPSRFILNYPFSIEKSPMETVGRTYWNPTGRFGLSRHEFTHTAAVSVLRRKQ